MKASDNMGEANFIFSQLTTEQAIVLIIALIIIVKTVWSAVEWIWKKIKGRFDIANENERWAQNITSSLEKLDKKIDNLELQNQKTHEEQEAIKDSLSLVQERLQENTRSFLIDAHHKFCYQWKAIDDINLQSIERRYLYYKTAGGNSFVDNLMEDIRALPRITVYKDNDGRPE